MENFLNFTNNISLPQIIGIIGGVGLILEAFRRMAFKFLTDWQESQFKLHRENQLRLVELEREIQQLRTCIHLIPGHPDAGLSGPQCDPGEPGEPGEP